MSFNACSHSTSGLRSPAFARSMIFLAIACLTSSSQSPSLSGAANHRAQLHRLLKTIDAGDLVIVTRLDRLARSTRDLLNILDKIARVGATLKSRGDTWADTTTAHGRLMLTVLGGLAEFERELIRVRTGEGRVRAKARGVHMGRPFKLNRHQQREAIARREAGEALTDIARTFGVHHTTIGRLRALRNFVRAGSVPTRPACRCTL